MPRRPLPQREQGQGHGQEATRAAPPSSHRLQEGENLETECKALPRKLSL